MNKKIVKCQGYIIVIKFLRMYITNFFKDENLSNVLCTMHYNHIK